MKESIEKHASKSTKVKFELEINAPVTSVFELLTTNAGLVQWFDELEVGEPGPSGHLLFVMTPEEKITMPILAWETNRILSFEWDDDNVTFELSESAENKTLVTFTEQLQTITDHTPRDVAGWHICLKKLQAIAKGNKYDFDKMEFETLFLKYQKGLNAEK
ncbi:SRPBCC domain-containing protein [Listeria ivanovii]|uniref:SRPBCC domain-containing protein n=2 Tax=Listeria ivanovii TaxID=1638 RepID=A0ABS1G8Y0_LISIV|nr:SRPBCC domain-containing protein [Listeria ivanovii]EFR98146.1 putative activator of Hsp90 ATPase 1 family protein [Listeria ivanovii FSL F6-596]AIS58842.1 ATPase [Listeria ivanovii subsp. londoniensis]AIS61647.1 ATPase [Listeria ivanovii subsp. londoniensis]MBK1963205.1 SRPBCC domain-containing protein [Listeria ivanovii subsp. londoniensis]MBK1965919.1 SRPBCC domain-containing protein [Listeria ivanovii subsp. londoniensis]